LKSENECANQKKIILIFIFFSKNELGTDKLKFQNQPANLDRENPVMPNFICRLVLDFYRTNAFGAGKSLLAPNEKPINPAWLRCRYHAPAR
jgi:hypothetical protein